MSQRLLAFGMLIFVCQSVASAAGLPVFESDEQADRWLRKNLVHYRQMAETVDRNGGYTIRSAEGVQGGLAYFKGGRGYLELSPAVKGAHRVSLIIFEMTNLFQEKRHLEVTNGVRRGEISTPIEFALMREIIEYDGLRLHRDVLVELEPVLGGVPPEMFTWVSTAKSFAEYQLPYAFDYLKAQAASGHTGHYLKLFEKHRSEYLDAVRNDGGPPSTNKK